MFVQQPKLFFCVTFQVIRLTWLNNKLILAFANASFIGINS